MLVSVFTPTYNRAYRLGALYHSLCTQTCRSFEWILVDDGSTDNTADLVSSWHDSVFPIIYIKQTNGGKHRAINRGVKEAKGDLFFIVDSDDVLPSNSIERILLNYGKISGDKSFCGVCGLKALYNGEMVHKGASYDVLNCSSIDFRYKYKMKGDMAEVIRTEVMKEYPFPEFDGEKFCSEAVLFNRIAQNYKFRYFFEIVYLCEYLDDGLTASIVKVRMSSPRGSSLCYSELFHCRIPFKQKVKAAINYWRFAFCDLKSTGNHMDNIGWGIVLLPIGLVYHLFDLRK